MIVNNDLCFVYFYGNKPKGSAKYFSKTHRTLPGPEATGYKLWQIQP